MTTTPERVLLPGERPGHITTRDMPAGFFAGVETIMTRKEAFDLIRRAEGKTPADWISWTHLGTAQQIVGYAELGLKSAQKALALKRNTLTLMNVAVILECLGRFDEAFQFAKEGVQLDPTHQFCGLLWAQGLLRQGNWKEGWDPFEWYSWGTIWEGELSEYINHWNGEDLNGKKILVLQGGGFGDNLMFFRWFRNLKAAGAHVTYACPDVMEPLLSRHHWVDAIHAVHEDTKNNALPEFYPKLGRMEHSHLSKAEVKSLRVDYDQGLPVKEICQKYGATWCPNYDYFVPIMGLARRFKATVESTAAESYPYITPDREKLALRKYVLRAPQRPFKKVGICWMGAERLDPRRHRSLTTEQVSRLLSYGGVDWVNLQYGVNAPVGGEHILNPQMKDWSDTAAIIECCDLVISVDTGVMHLAGAIGKKCWALIPGLSDWKFLLGRDDMVFYPSVRLFRNKGEGLDNALDSVIEAIKKWA